MKIKYKIDSGEIVAMGDMHNIEPGDGEEVRSIDKEIPASILHYTFDGQSLVKKDEAEIEKIESERSFSMDVALSHLEDAVGENRVDDLDRHIRRVERYAARKDFGKIRRLGERLVNKGKLDQAELDGLKAIMLAQGINLDNY